MPYLSIVLALKRVVLENMLLYLRGVQQEIVVELFQHVFCLVNLLNFLELAGVVFVIEHHPKHSVLLKLQKTRY